MNTNAHPVTPGMGGLFVYKHTTVHFACFVPFFGTDFNLLQKQHLHIPFISVRIIHEQMFYKEVNIMERTEDRYFKQTEARLYRYKALCARIAEFRRELDELANMNYDSLMHSSRSFISMLKTGMRLDPSDAFEMQMARIRAYMSADEYEVREIRRALSHIRKDPYYTAIDCKYFRHMTDAEAVEKMNCSLSALRRNRTRLVHILADYLYGAS